MVGLTLGVIGLLGAAGQAQAVACNQSLLDVDGRNWTQTSSTLRHLGPNGSFDIAKVAVDGAIFDEGGSTDCDSSLGGRELTWPLTATGPIKVERRIWVPQGSPSFTRYFDTFRNDTALPQTVALSHYDTTATSSIWRNSSTADAVVTLADDWAVMADTAAPNPPANAWAYGKIWHANVAAGVRPTRLLQHPFGAPQPWMSGTSQTAIVWDDVELAPGASVSLMHLVVLRASIADAEATAEALAAEPEMIYTGLTAAEKASLINWPAYDGDGDGVLDAVDNCAKGANADQVDTDVDGDGDVCDSDDDGDGLSDAVEAALGSDPRVVDSDGDSVADGADRCPTLVGSAPSGCPAFVTTVIGGSPVAAPPVTSAAAVDRTRPKLVLSRVPSTMKLKTFLKGVNGRAQCDEPCALVFELRGSARSVRLARFEVTLGTRSLRLGGGTRAFAVKPKRKLVGRARKLTVRLRVTATDAAGNRTVANKNVRVR